jgi:alpha-beta hydrolase superfamily lysophospholipase
MSESSTGTVCREISFLSESFLLKGVLHLPGMERPPVVIGSHGLLSSSRSPKQIALAHACNGAGIAFFRFDHRGRGRSEGVFQEVTSLDARRIDLASAVKTMRSRADIGDQLGFFGSSMGGAVCISAASEFAVDAVVTFAAPVRSSSILEALKKNDHVSTLKTAIIQKHLRSDISDKLSSLHHILIIHGDADQVVPPSNAQEIYSKAGNPKKLIMQPRGDHRMSNEDHQKKFIKESVSWFKYCFNLTVT